MRTLIVIAKAPLRGYAKTRLVREGALSEADVARLADAFVRDTLAACERVEDVHLVICYAPRDSEPYFRGLAPNARCIEQVEGDLGQRMSAAFDAVFACGATRAVAIGTDTPHLSPLVLARAFGELDACDRVLGPADDGGYYLIGLRARRPEIFEGIEWSSPRVLAQSLERARACGATTRLLEGLFDVDDAASLARLERSIELRTVACPHTENVLADVRRERGLSSDADDGERTRA